MIGPLLEQAARRASAADVVLKTDETLTLSFESGRLKSTGLAQERGCNLRVVADGRMGFAGSTGNDPDALLEAALASARVGEAVQLTLPGPAPLPKVRTHSPRTASATVAELVQLGQALASRLRQDDRQVNLTIERSVGSVQVANSAGANASYDVSLITIGAEIVRVSGDDVLIVGNHLAQCDFPALSELERFSEDILQRIAWAGQEAEAPAGSVPVIFCPEGLSVLLLPLQLAFQGKSVLQRVSPVADDVGKESFSRVFSLTDDPLLDGRSGSRPVDDEAVPSRVTRLVDRGVVREFIYDLETASRAHARPSGHGRRSTFGKPQAAYSNLVVAPGEAPLESLLRQVGDGLLVAELLGVGQGNVIGGAFSHPVALAYRVRDGEVIGRVRHAAVAGNAYDLLRQVIGVSSESRWLGSSSVPFLAVEGVSVARR